MRGSRAAGLFVAAAMAAGGGAACTSSGHRVARAVQPLTLRITAPAEPPEPAAPTPRPPSVVADALLTSVGIFPAPGAPPSGTLPNPNSLGQPLVFRVLQSQGAW